MPVAADEFRRAMGSLPGGVTVIGATGSGGAIGMTATSVTSLSLDPPMLLVCVDRAAALHAPIVAAARFSVSVLAAAQQPIAERFALRERQAWPDAASLSPGGLPLVAGAVAHIECLRGGIHAGGDHTIVTGIIEWTALHGGAPLCYGHSGYTRLAP